MTVEETTERSAELLRLALPLISRHGNGFQPMSYAIWYEYVAGGNPALRQELDATVRSGGRLDRAVTFDLYNKHLIDHAELAVRRARSGLLDVLDKMQTSVADANSGTAAFNARLTEFNERVAESESPETLREQVGDMLAEAQKMGTSLGQLRSEFEFSQGEVVKLSEELRRMRQEVLTDPLTNLMNRRGFDGALSGMIEMARKESSALTLLMLDIDHFKKVNDAYGHLFGDQVIRGVAQAMKASIKGQDIAARHGGEEFAVLLPSTDLKGGSSVAEHIRSSVERSKIRRANSNEAVGNITISIGAAQFRVGESAENLIQRADAALYQSKNSGRNRVTIAG
jgi:diguanylate cyclase